MTLLKGPIEYKNHLIELHTDDPQQPSSTNRNYKIIIKVGEVQLMAVSIDTDPDFFPEQDGVRFDAIIEIGKGILNNKENAFRLYDKPVES